MRRRALGAAFALAALSGCGSAASSTGSADAPPARLAIRPESVGSPLPEVVVRHLQGHSWVQLKNALPSTKPVLVWFWAPH